MRLLLPVAFFVLLSFEELLLLLTDALLLDFPKLNLEVFVLAVSSIVDVLQLVAVAEVLAVKEE